MGYAPHQGMTGGGNDFLFAYNTFDTLCYETSDSGAWYAGRSWSHRGSRIENNFFQRIQQLVPIVLGSVWVNGIYLDDQLSAHNLTDNIIYNSMNGILLGGGRRVEIHGNQFANNYYDIHFDNRGMTWQTSYCEVNGTFQKELEALNYQQPPLSPTSLSHTLSMFAVLTKQKQMVDALPRIGEYYERIPMRSGV